jgi:methionine-rich copper-binding protein CopC
MMPVQGSIYVWDMATVPGSQTVWAVGVANLYNPNNPPKSFSVAVWNGSSWTLKYSNVAYPNNAPGLANALVVTPDGWVWMGASTGYVYKWKADGSTTSPIYVTKLSSVSDMAVDAGGALWVAGDGVWVGASFEARTPDGFRGPARAIVAAPGGGVYVADYYGTVYFWDGSAWQNLGKPAGMAYVFAMVVAPDGKLWVGGDYGHVSCWDGSRWQDMGQVRGSWEIGSLAAAPDGSIWAASWWLGRVARWDGSAWHQAPDVTVPYPADPSVIYVPYFHDIAVTEDGRVWVCGGYEDVLRLDGTQWTRWRLVNGSDWMYELCSLPGNRMFAGDLGSRTFFWNGSAWLNGGQIEYYAVVGSAVAPDGSVWVTLSNSKLFRWNGSAWEYRSSPPVQRAAFLWPSGWPSGGHATLSVVVLDDGRVVVAGQDGKAAVLKDGVWESLDPVPGGWHIYHLLLLPGGELWAAGANGRVARVRLQGDTEPPQVVSTDPADGATGVPVGKTITVTFSEDVVQSDGFGQISVRDTSGRVVDCSVFVGGSMLTIDPSTDLAYGTTYTVTIPATAVKDLGGNTLAADYAFGFTTGAAPDTAPPVVVGTDPANNAADVPVGKTVTVTFSEDVRAGPAYNGIRVEDAAGNAVVAAKSIAGRVLVIDPGADLAWSTRYSVVAPAGAVEDLAGNALAEGYAFAFTTQAVPCGEELDVEVAGAIPYGEGEDIFITRTCVVRLRPVNLPPGATWQYGYDGVTWGGSWYCADKEVAVLLPVKQGDVAEWVYVRASTGAQKRLSFVYDPVAPEIRVLRGRGGATCATGPAFQIEVRASDNLAEPLFVRWRLAGGKWSAPVELGGIVEVSGLAPGANYVEVEVSDLAGNASRGEVLVFRVSD